MNPFFARGWLRWEAVAAFTAALLLYHHFGLSWFWFAVLFLVPDLSMLGYLASPRVGALLYNTVHCYAVAGLAVAAGWIVQGRDAPPPALIAAGLIWCAHIAFDRVVGYGLKSPEEFHHTHLGRVGRKAAPAPIE